MHVLASNYEPLKTDATVLSAGQPASPATIGRVVVGPV